MKIKLVDAAKIRNTIDTDFSGVATHDSFYFIPRGELWVDRCLKGERALFVKLTQLERAMKDRPFQEIRRTAMKTLTEVGDVRTIKAERHASYRIVYVDGADVRRYLDPYFLLGGHDLVYPYIPKQEIWIDTRSDPAEWKYTLIHELDERQRMKQGMSYDDAHDFALAAERAARRKDDVAHFTRG